MGEGIVWRQKQGWLKKLEGNGKCIEFKRNVCVCALLQVLPDQTFFFWKTSDLFDIWHSFPNSSLFHPSDILIFVFFVALNRTRFLFLFPIVFLRLSAPQMREKHSGTDFLLSSFPLPESPERKRSSACRGIPFKQYTCISVNIGSLRFSCLKQSTISEHPIQLFIYSCLFLAGTARAVT